MGIKKSIPSKRHTIGAHSYPTWEPLGSYDTEEIMANPLATEEVILLLPQLKQIKHPNCPAPLWWQLAAEFPGAARLSILYPLMTLEAPERWEQLEKDHAAKWIDKYTPKLTEQNQRRFAADCAERVLPVFEKKDKKDKGPRRAIELARAYANGTVRKAELHAAHESAKKACATTKNAKAACAADAAASVALVHGSSAGWYDETGEITYYAPYTAKVAAEAAAPNSTMERVWQWHRLLQYLTGKIPALGKGAKESTVGGADDPHEWAEDPEEREKWKGGHDYRIEAKMLETIKRTHSTPIRIAIAAITGGMPNVPDDKSPIPAAIHAMDMLGEAYDVNDENYDLDDENLLSPIQRLEGKFLVSQDPIDVRLYALQVGASWGKEEDQLLKNVFGLSVPMGKDPHRALAKQYVETILPQLRAKRVPAIQAIVLAKQLAALMLLPAFLRLPEYLGVGIVSGQTSLILLPRIIGLLSVRSMTAATPDKVVERPAQEILTAAKEMGVQRLALSIEEMKATKGLIGKESVYRKAFTLLLGTLNKSGIQLIDVLDDPAVRLINGAEIQAVAKLPTQKSSGVSVGARLSPRAIRHHLGAIRSREEIIADPQATAEEVEQLNQWDALQHPNCPAALWWKLAADDPKQAQKSMLWPLFSLEEPERWLAIENKHLKALIADESTRLTPSQRHLFAADCAARVLPLFESSFPKDKRPREAIRIRRLLAHGKADASEWAEACAAADEARRNVPASNYPATYAALAASVVKNEKVAEAAAGAVAAKAMQDCDVSKATWALGDAAATVERRWQLQRVREHQQGVR